MMLIRVPDYVKAIQNRLIENKYECYLVGGCVRDTLLGLEAKDYDLTTNCDASTLKNIFSDYSIVNNNGEKHNTITLHINNDNVEITTFKHNEDEANTLANDLLHRDLTINALAYSDSLIDICKGKNDLDNHIVRAVGNPYERIEEDPLRILRYLRFASILNFNIDELTSKAIHDCVDLLANVSAERIRCELDKILVGANLKTVLFEYKDVIFKIIPELKKCDGFIQNNPYHSNDIYTHIANVCLNVRNDSVLKMAALLHDIGKPDCYSVDDKGIGHFYNHAVIGCEIASSILKRLRYSNEETRYILYLIENHDKIINLNKRSIKKNYSYVLDENLFYKLIELINADKADHTTYSLIDLEGVKSILKDIISDNECMSLKNLAVNGNDMIALGYSGHDIRLVLEYLLKNVIKDSFKNEREELLIKAKNYIRMNKS